MQGNNKTVHRSKWPNRDFFSLSSRRHKWRYKDSLEWRDSPVNGFNEFSNIICTVNEEACCHTVPVVRCRVHLESENELSCVHCSALQKEAVWVLDAYLEEIAGHHIESSFGLGLGRTHIGECDGHHLIFARCVINKLMHPRIKCVLIFHDAFVQYEIRCDQHEQGEFISLTVVAAIGQLIG